MSQLFASFQNSIPTHNKARFHSAGRALLAKLAQELHLTTDQRNIRSCKGGPAIMGEVILHTDEIYVQVHSHGVMFRTCNGRKDYSGGHNNFASHAVLNDPHAFALCLRGHIVAKLARAC